MEHTDRDRVVQEFRDGATKILIATDVLSRGFDVSQVSGWAMRTTAQQPAIIGRCYDDALLYYSPPLPGQHGLGYTQGSRTCRGLP